MIQLLKDIARLSSGLYLKPDMAPDTLYLQAVNFDGFGELNPLVEPQIKLTDKNKKHLLEDGDILFAAKGVHNFGVVYREAFGRAVASSSFVIIKINANFSEDIKPDYLAWFLSHTPDIKTFHQKQLGTTIPSISIKKLGELSVKIPHIEKQNIITKIQALRNRESLLLKQIEAQKEKHIQQLLIKTLNN